MVASSSPGASPSTTCQPQLPSRQCLPQISHSGSPSLWVSWMKTTLMSDSRASSSRFRIAGMVPSALGTTSVPPSVTKSFCMSPMIKAVRLGSTRTPSCTSYSGISMVRATLTSSDYRPSPSVPLGRLQVSGIRLLGLQHVSPLRLMPPWARLLAPPQHRYYLPDHQGGEDHERAEDLDRHEPVPCEPVPEQRGEDGFHGKDDRGPRRRDVLLHRSLHQESAGRCQESGHQQSDPHPRRRQRDGSEERPHDEEEQRYREDLGQRKRASVVGSGVTGEERDVQPESC